MTCFLSKILKLTTPKEEKNVTMKMSPAGLEMTKYFEGCFLKAYQDSVGVWTIAWGAIKWPDGTSVKEGDTCTQEQADEMLAAQVDSEGGHYVRAWAGPLVVNQAQFDALTDFCYNRGAKRLRDLLAMSHSTQECADNILKWDWAGSPPKVLLGLQRRRRSERAFYLGQDWAQFKDWTP